MELHPSLPLYDTSHLIRGSLLGRDLSNAGHSRRTPRSVSVIPPAIEDAQVPFTPIAVQRFRQRTPADRIGARPRLGWLPASAFLRDSWVNLIPPDEVQAMVIYA